MPALQACFAASPINCAEVKGLYVFRTNVFDSAACRCRSPPVSNRGPGGVWRLKRERRVRRLACQPSGPDNGTLTSVSDTYSFTLTNASSSLVLGIAGQSQTAGTALAQEANAGAATTDDQWHAMPMGSSQLQYNVENLLTHQVMGIANASTAAGALALQWADNGTNDHLWEFYLLKDGNYLIQNANSSLYLEDSGSGTTSSAVIDQGARATTGTGCSCQEWTLAVSMTPAYAAPRVVTGTGIYVHDPYMLKDPNGTYWLMGPTRRWRTPPT